MPLTANPAFHKTKNMVVEFLERWRSPSKENTSFITYSYSYFSLHLTMGQDFSIARSHKTGAAFRGPPSLPYRDVDEVVPNWLSTTFCQKKFTSSVVLTVGDGLQDKSPQWLRRRLRSKTTAALSIIPKTGEPLIGRSNTPKTAPLSYGTFGFWASIGRLQRSDDEICRSPPFINKTIDHLGTTSEQGRARDACSMSNDSAFGMSCVDTSTQEQMAMQRLLSGNAHFEGAFDATKKRSQTVNTTRKIPVEIALEVVKHLPPAEIMAVNYTCRWAFHRLGLLLSEVLRKTESPSLRLELLFMLDRDGKLPRSMSICRACSTLHKDNCFSEAPAQLDKKNIGKTQEIVVNNTRQCLGTTGMVWICPHTQVDYHQVFKDSKPASPRNACSVCKVFLKAEKLRFQMRFSIMEVESVSALPMQSEVSAALAELDACICPHVRFNSPIVSKIYAEMSKQNQHTIIVSETPSFQLRKGKSSLGIHNGCQICQVRIDFSVSKPGTELRLTATRVIKEGYSVTDPIWTSQLAQPCEFENLAMDWNVFLSKIEPAASKPVLTRISSKRTQKRGLSKSTYNSSNKSGHANLNLNLDSISSMARRRGTLLGDLLSIAPACLTALLQPMD